MYDRLATRTLHAACLLCAHCALTGVSSTNTCDALTTHSPPTHHLCTYQVLHHVLATYSLCTPYVLTLYSLCTPYVLPMYSLCTPYVLPMYSLCTHHVLPMYSLCTPSVRPTRHLQRALLLQLSHAVLAEALTAAPPREQAAARSSVAEPSGEGEGAAGGGCGQGSGTARGHRGAALGPRVGFVNRRGGVFACR